MSTPTFEVSSEKIPIQAEPLTPEGFEPFGSVISPGHLGNDGEANSVAANQGTAVKFIEVSTSQSLYDNAPSGKIPSHTNWNLFRCSPPVHLMTSAEPSDSQEAESPAQIEYLSKVLERHPFSTQTFLPLGRSKDQQGYLVIVSLKNPESEYRYLSLIILAGCILTFFPTIAGLPDLDTVRAFIANGNQAVTYGVGEYFQILDYNYYSSFLVLTWLRNMACPNGSAWFYS